MRRTWINQIFVFCLVLTLLIPFAFAQEDEELPPLPKGPLLLTSVRPEQLNADYWINRLPNPDKVLKTPEQMKEFNREINVLVPDQQDIFAMETRRTGSGIRSALQSEYGTISKRKLFDSRNRPIPASFFSNEILPNLNLDAIPNSIRIEWGVAARQTHVRALPTAKKMIEGVDDIEFDQLQFSQIKLWTPVAIYHRSADGAWVYLQAPYVRGWARSRDISIFDSRDEIKKLVRDGPFLVVLDESVPVCLRPDCGPRAAGDNVYARASMGTILPRMGREGNHYSVQLPLRSASGKVSLRTGYVSTASDVAPQFPAYTQRNIISQAFKLLSARYGWGGMYDGRDCSGFLHDVYLSLGVNMPRASARQGIIGTQMGVFKTFEHLREKLITIKHATPGIAIFRMPMHMMIYLGEENGQHYIIHSTWAERISMTSDEKNRINQVVVSDLELNGRSRIGSLLDRIISINEVN